MILDAILNPMRRKLKMSVRAWIETEIATSNNAR